MEELNRMSRFVNRDSSKNENTISINVTTAWFILTIVVLVVLVAISLYSFFTKTMEPKDNEIPTWFIFTLIGASISCIFGTITSHLSQKSESNRDKNLVQEITDNFLKKINEITGEMNVALKRSDLISGNREDILRLLMNHSTLNGEIIKIKILAHDSSTFSEFFKTYSKDIHYICKDLEILIHSQSGIKIIL